jgi:hypothetical protein
LLRSTLQHPAYSPDLASSDFHLFPTLKVFLDGRHFNSNEEVKDAVKERVNGLAAEVYDEGIQKLITLWQVPEYWCQLCRKITFSL